VARVKGPGLLKGLLRQPKRSPWTSSARRHRVLDVAQVTLHSDDAGTRHQVK